MAKIIMEDIVLEKIILMGKLICTLVQYYYYTMLAQSAFSDLLHAGCGEVADTAQE